MMIRFTSFIFSVFIISLISFLFVDNSHANQSCEEQKQEMLRLTQISVDASSAYQDYAQQLADKYNVEKFNITSDAMRMHQGISLTTAEDAQLTQLKNDRMQASESASAIGAQWESGCSADTDDASSNVASQPIAPTRPGSVQSHDTDTASSERVDSNPSNNQSSGVDIDNTADGASAGVSGTAGSTINPNTTGRSNQSDGTTAQSGVAQSRSGDSAIYVSRADDFLGSGFSGDDDFGITGLSGSAENNLVQQRGGGFAEKGVRDINALLYNVIDFLRYGAASFAALWLIISAFQLVASGDDESVKSAKKGIQWSIVGLVVMFAINLAVITFFEGGSVADTDAGPGASLVTVIRDDKGNEFTIANDLMGQMASFFLSDVRELFEFLKVWGSAFAILFLFVVGFWIVNAAGNEETVDKGKGYLVHLLTAFTALIVLDTFIFDFLYPTDQSGLNNPACLAYIEKVADVRGNIDLTRSFPIEVNGTAVQCPAAEQLARTGVNTILGVVRFFETIIGTVAVFFMIYAGIRIVSSLGEDDAIATHKKQLIWSLAGLGVILFSEQVIIRVFFRANLATGEVSTNITQGIIDIAGIVNFLITFVSVFSMVSMFIAGVVWVVNFGNTELADKAKKAVLASVAGLVISISAFALVNTLISGRSDSGEETQTDVTIQAGGVQVNLEN